MVYRALNANGEEVNIVEIEPEQIEGWERLTGLKLELIPAQEESGKTETETIDFAQAYVDLLAETIAKEEGLEV